MWIKATDPATCWDSPNLRRDNERDNDEQVCSARQHRPKDIQIGDPNGQTGDDDRAVHLSRKEYGLIALLSQHKGTVVTKEMFLEHLYGGIKEPGLKIIDVFVCHLRKKLARATGGNQYIETVWGRGYVLRDPILTVGRPQPVQHEGMLT
jgi:DNA-binding response OmpR family regulator